MTDLLARLEVAEAGSRELDCLIARHFGWHRVEPRHARNKAGGWIAPEDFLGVNSDGSPRLDSLHGTDIHRDPPRLSQSLDAALALAERVLPGWHCHIGNLPTSDDADHEPHHKFAALLYQPEPYVRNRKDFMEHGATPALALCIAILRAKGAEQ